MAGEFGQTAPAMAPTEQGGKDMRQRVLAGLGVQILSIAHAISPTTEQATSLAKAMADLGKVFAKPPEDLGLAEMKFLMSQLSPMPKPQAMDMGQEIQGQFAGMGVGGAPQGA